MAVVVVKYIAILTLVILIVLLPLWIKLYRVSRLRKIQSLSSCDIYERLMEMLHFAGDFTGYNGTEEDFAYKLSARYGNITYERSKKMYTIVLCIYVLLIQIKAGHIIRRMYWSYTEKRRKKFIRN